MPMASVMATRTVLMRECEQMDQCPRQSTLEIVFSPDKEVCGRI